MNWGATAERPEKYAAFVQQMEWREDVGRIMSLELTESRNDAKAKGGLKIQK